MLLKEESLSRKFITKGAWIYFFILLTAPISYSIRIILTNELSPSDIGIIYGIIGLLGLLGSYTDFGLTESLNYFLPKYIIKNDYGRVKYLLKTTIFVQIITSSLVGVGLICGSSWIADHYFHATEAKNAIEIFTLFFIGGHLLVVITTFLNAIQNTRLQKFLDFLRYSIVLLGSIILLFGDLGNLEMYAWTWVGGVYGTYIIAAIIFYRSYYRPFLSIPTVQDLTLRKTFIKYSIGTLFSANVATILHQIDMQFIIYFLGVTEAGIYSYYQSLVSIPYVFIGPIIGFLYPVISEIGGRGDHKKIITLFGIFSTNLSIIMLWIGALFFLTGPYIAGFLFGKNFILSGTALLFISPFLVFNILMQIQFQILSGLGFIKKRIEILLWTLGLNIFLSLVCIFGYKTGVIPFPNGSSAASFAVGISWILMWYLSRKATYEFIQGFDWKQFIWNLLGVCIFIPTISSLLYIKGLNVYNLERITYLQVILLALFSALLIFFVINRITIQKFISTIRDVRKGTI